MFHPLAFMLFFLSVRIFQVYDDTGHKLSDNVQIIFKTGLAFLIKQILVTVSANHLKNIN